MALALAILNQTYPPHMRSHAIGIWAAIGAVGFGAGPVAGGLLLGSFGWASVFWVNLPIIVIASLMASIVIPHAASRDPKCVLDGMGIILASVGLTCITFSLIESTSKPWNPVLTLAPGFAGLLALALFARWQCYAAAPLIPQALRRARSFLGACGVYFASYTAFAGMLYYVTIFFQNFERWSPFETGLSWLLMNIPFIATAQLAGRFDRHFAPRNVIVLGCFFAATGVTLLASLTGGTSFVVAAVGYVAAGLGYGALVPSITHVAMRDVPANAVGVGSAVLNCSRQLGTATGLAIIGTFGTSAASKDWGSATADRLNDPAFFTTTIATGRIDAVLKVVGANFQEAAVSAFLHGYQTALIACVVCLAIAAMISLRAFRPVIG